MASRHVESRSNGLLPWAHPRPWTLLAYLALLIIQSTYYYVIIYDGNGNIFGTILSVIVVYFLWRGSRLAWIISIIGTAIAIFVNAGFTFMARTPGGHEPWMHGIALAFFLAEFIFLLLPPTRRFYDLEQRTSREPS